MTIDNYQTIEKLSPKNYFKDILADSNKLERLACDIKNPFQEIERASGFLELAKINAEFKKLKSDPFSKTLNALNTVSSRLDSLSGIGSWLIFDEHDISSIDTLIYTAESLNDKLELVFPTEQKFSWPEFIANTFGNDQKKMSRTERLARVKSNLSSKIEEIKKQREAYFELLEAGYDEFEWDSLYPIETITGHDLWHLFTVEFSESVELAKDKIDSNFLYVVRSKTYSVSRDLRTVFGRTLERHFKTLDDEDSSLDNSIYVAMATKNFKELLMSKNIKPNVSRKKAVASPRAEATKIKKEQVFT